MKLQIFIAFLLLSTTFVSADQWAYSKCFGLCSFNKSHRILFLWIGKCKRGCDIVADGCYKAAGYYFNRDFYTGKCCQTVSCAFFIKISIFAATPDPGIPAIIGCNLALGKNNNVQSKMWIVTDQKFLCRNLQDDLYRRLVCSVMVNVSWTLFLFAAWHLFTHFHLYVYFASPADWHRKKIWKLQLNEVSWNNEKCHEQHSKNRK